MLDCIPLYSRDDRESSYFLNEQNSFTHTLKPILTGSSVLGLRFKEGVMLAADNLGIKIHLIPISPVKSFL